MQEKKLIINDMWFNELLFKDDLLLFLKLNLVTNHLTGYVNWYYIIFAINNTVSNKYFESVFS